MIHFWFCELHCLSCSFKKDVASGGGRKGSCYAHGLSIVLLRRRKFATGHGSNAYIWRRCYSLYAMTAQATSHRVRTDHQSLCPQCQPWCARDLPSWRVLAFMLGARVSAPIRRSDCISTTANRSKGPKDPSLLSVLSCKWQALPHLRAFKRPEKLTRRKLSYWYVQCSSLFVETACASVFSKVMVDNASSVAKEMTAAP